MTYRYDQWGTLTGLADNLGELVTEQRKPAGQLVQQTDAAGGIHRYRYDLAGKLLDETDPLSNVRTPAVQRSGRAERR